MRDIKFRAFDKFKNIMIDDQCQDVQKHYPYVKFGEYIHDVVWRVGKSQNTLMQYIGIKDDFGAEIFEGDILSFNYRFRLDEPPDMLDHTTRIARVVWSNISSCFCYEYAIEENVYFNFFRNRDHENLKVIANIYQNNELYPYPSKIEEYELYELEGGK